MNLLVCKLPLKFHWSPLVIHNTKCHEYRILHHVLKQEELRDPLASGRLNATKHTLLLFHSISKDQGTCCKNYIDDETHTLTIVLYCYQFG